MGRTHKHRPKEHVVNASETTRRHGKQYVTCLCGRKLLIGRVSAYDVGREDMFAECASEKCGVTVRVRKRS